jgi:hypothetical protein
MNNFYRDNVVSTRFEKEVLVMAFSDPNISNAYKWSGGNHPEYDIEINYKDNNRKTIEVKTQRIYNLNNDYITIEYEQNNKPSGINLSSADFYYIFKIDNDTKKNLIKKYYDLDETVDENLLNYRLYKIKTDDLKKLIEIEKRNIKISSFGDQKGGSKSFLVPISILCRYNVEIKDGLLKKEDLDKLEIYKKIHKNKCLYEK